MKQVGRRIQNVFQANATAIADLREAWRRDISFTKEMQVLLNKWSRISVARISPA